MARSSIGRVIERERKAGTVFALRFTAYGRREYVALGSSVDGWTRRKAEDELTLVMAQVRQGAWQPDTPAASEGPGPVPAFHEFASEWFAAHSGEWTEATRADYLWQLRDHLLPFFCDHRVSAITVSEVDRYRERKLAEARRRGARIDAARTNGETARWPSGEPVRALSATSINKTLTRVGQILEVAAERDLVDRNPLRVNPRNRKLRASSPRAVWLDRADQIAALLNAAGSLDVEHSEHSARGDGRRAMIAVGVFAGLRVGQLCALRWRDVDLAGGR
jgi:integrase